LLYQVFRGDIAALVVVGIDVRNSREDIDPSGDDKRKVSEALERRDVFRM